MFAMLSFATMASLWNTPSFSSFPLPGKKYARQRTVEFSEAISKVESMVWNQKTRALARKHGLSVLNVTWEDTGRSKNSALGPNISDMTIGVRDKTGKLHPMPVLRFDNFNDKTADIRADKFYLPTGNTRDRRMKVSSLESILKNVRTHLHDPKSWKGSKNSLWNKRDNHVLVSAQACFLPIPQDGEATFTPVIYNYQSSKGNPAVLTIVATREGTSIQVVENDSGYMSEALYFNEDGERAPFTATRLSDFKAQGGDETTSAENATEDANLNVVLLIQVPLKHKPRRRASFGYGGLKKSKKSGVPSSAPMEAEMSDVEVAVVGHGETEGPFKEINNLRIERDPRFPIRVTTQFYKATSNGVVTEADIREIRAQIDRVYDSGDYVGSLVSSGYTHRPTEWVDQPRKSNIWADPSFGWHKAWDF